MTDDELPAEFAKVWADAQCNCDQLRELATVSGAEAAVDEATDSLERAKELVAQAQEIAEDTD